MLSVGVLRSVRKATAAPSCIFLGEAGIRHIFHLFAFARQLLGTTASCHAILDFYRMYVKVKVCPAGKIQRSLNCVWDWEWGLGCVCGTTKQTEETSNCSTARATPERHNYHDDESNYYSQLESLSLIDRSGIPTTQCRFCRRSYGRRVIAFEFECVATPTRSHCLSLRATPHDTRPQTTTRRMCDMGIAR